MYILSLVRFIYKNFNLERPKIDMYIIYSQSFLLIIFSYPYSSKQRI